MRRFLLVGSFSALAGTAVLVSCSGPGGNTKPFTPNGDSVQVMSRGAFVGEKPVSPATMTGVNLYVSLPLSGYVLGFVEHGLHNRPPACKIGSSRGITHPVGLQVDESGNLYVADGNAKTVSVFASGCGKRIAKVANVYGGPYGGAGRQIALNGGFRGTWYVANTYGVASNTANVAVCSTSGCKSELTMPSPGLFEVLGVAVDATGNVFADAVPASPDPYYHANLYEWPKGQMPGHLVKAAHELFYNLRISGDLEIDNQSNFVVRTQLFNLYVLSGCPSSCVAHGPYRAPKEQSIAEGALNKANTLFYSADGGSGSPSQPGSVFVYKYLGVNGLKVQRRITAGIQGVVFDVAVYPPASP